MAGVDVVVAVLLAVGLVGIVLPVLPGLLLVWAAILLWATEAQTTAGWVLLAVATVAIASVTVLSYVRPGRDLATSGVPRRTLVAGGVLGVVGFFVVPVLGLPLGFVLGVFLAERIRLRDVAGARVATGRALRSIGRSVLVSLATGVAVAVAWAVVAVTT